MVGTTTENLINTALSYPDMVFFGAIFGVLILYGLFRGVKALSELAIALPVSAFLFKIFPFSIGWGEPALFGLLVVGSVWVVNRDTSGLDDSNSLFKVLLAAIGATALVAVIITNFVDISSIYSFAQSTLAFIQNERYAFYIASIGFISVALSRKV